MLPKAQCVTFTTSNVPTPQLYKIARPIMYRTNVKIVKTAEKTITVRTFRSTFIGLPRKVLIALLSRVVDPDTELFDQFDI